MSAKFEFLKNLLCLSIKIFLFGFHPTSGKGYNNIIHRDIKPHCVLLARYVSKSWNIYIYGNRFSTYIISTYNKLTIAPGRLL